MNRFLVLGRSFLRDALVTLLGLVCVDSAVACIWTYGTDVHGHAVQVNERSPEAFIERLTTPHHDRAHWEKEKSKLEPLLPNADFKVHNDFAAALLHLNEVPRAVKILESLAEKHPDEYVIAANLGTAYELAGDNEKALHWIREGVRLNPDSHFGSEWVHIKILEAKQKLARDPNWLHSHNILGLDFGDAEIPKKPVHSKELEKLANDVAYQLHERLQFTPAKDPIVADLLFDLGNLVAVSKSVEYAVPVYELALKYGPTNPVLVAQRRDSMIRIAESSMGTPFNPLTSVVDGGVIIIPIIGLAMLIWMFAVVRKRRAAAD
jgi:hypothetical protein